MKELTHYVFSAGALLYGLSLVGALSLSSVTLAVWLSFSVNYTIDAVGHSRGGAPSRTRITHSVFTAPLWGALIAFLSSAVASHTVPPYVLSAGVSLWVGAGVLAAITHLLLDSITQAGVFYWRNRIAMAHFRYDNVPLNAGFVAVGLLLIVVAVTPIGPIGQAAPIHLSLVGIPAGNA